MATHSAYNLARDSDPLERRARRRSRPSEVASIDYEGGYHDKFYMPTRCWAEKYSPLLTLNERRLYEVLALNYNEDQMRSFPGRDQMETYFCPDSSEERRSRRSLAMLGIIELWKEPKGKRHFWRFFRLPHVAPDLRHYGNRKQHSADELLSMKSLGELPEGYEWLEKPGVQLLTPRVTQENIADEIGRRLERWNRERQ